MSEIVNVWPYEEPIEEIYTEDRLSPMIESLLRTLPDHPVTQMLIQNHDQVVARFKDLSGISEAEANFQQEIQLLRERGGRYAQVLENAANQSLLLRDSTIRIRRQLEDLSEVVDAADIDEMRSIFGTIHEISKLVLTESEKIKTDYEDLHGQILKDMERVKNSAVKTSNKSAIMTLLGMGLLIVGGVATAGIGIAASGAIATVSGITVGVTGTTATAAVAFKVSDSLDAWSKAQAKIADVHGVASRCIRADIQFWTGLCTSSQLTEQQCSDMVQLFNKNPRYLQTIQRRYSENLPILKSKCQNLEQGLGAYLVHLEQNRFLSPTINLPLLLGDYYQLAITERERVMERISVQ